MGAISKETLERALQLIKEFRNKLDKNFSADKLLDGTLYELNVHFLQRAMPNSYCYDLDFIVIEYDKPKALIEIKTENGKLSENQRKVYQKIAAALEIPAFLLIFYNEDKFQIKQLNDQKDLGFFTYEQLTKWFQEIPNEITKVEEKKGKKLPQMADYSKIVKEMEV